MHPMQANIIEVHVTKEEALNGWIGKAELGHAWARYMFGKTPEFLNIPLDPLLKSGLKGSTLEKPKDLLIPFIVAGSREQRNELRYLNDRPNMWYQVVPDSGEFENLFLPIDWVTNWFREEHWSDIRRTDEIRAMPTRQWCARIAVVRKSQTAGEEVSGAQNTPSGQIEDNGQYYAHVEILLK
jgi:hypothetical protein